MPTFTAIAPHLKTGDIILFSGPQLESREIELIESELVPSGAAFASHVAMVVRLRDRHEPLLWESSPLAQYPDILTGRPAPGVHLLVASALLLHCGARDYQFAWRALAPELPPQAWGRLEGFLVQSDGEAFPSTVEMGALFALGRALNLHDPTKTYFCAELVAATYIALGLLPPDRAANSYCPEDFSSTSGKDLPLLGDFTLRANQEFTLV